MPSKGRGRGLGSATQANPPQDCRKPAEAPAPRQRSGCAVAAASGLWYGFTRLSAEHVRGGVIPARRGVPLIRSDRRAPTGRWLAMLLAVAGEPSLVETLRNEHRPIRPPKPMYRPCERADITSNTYWDWLYNTGRIISCWRRHVASRVPETLESFPAGGRHGPGLDQGPMSAARGP
jgi:hypothetical protein